MKITHIEIYRFSIKMEPFVIATGTMNFAQNVFIRVYTDAGLYGVGECSAFPMIVGETQETCLALAREFAAVWKGKDPLDIETRMNDLDDHAAYNHTIKSAFDIALYDISAKAANLPLYKFLGGEKRPVETDITVGISSAETMAAKALNFVHKGAEILKIKLGKDPQTDIDRIHKIRKAVGYNIKIRIDANQGWNFTQALEALKGLEQYEIEFCEQPMRSWDDRLLPDLRSLTTVKIMADESCYSHRDAERLIAMNACDYINIKFAKAGGILESKKIYETASAGNIPCMIGGMLESRIALSAKLHFAYACPNIHLFDLDTCMIGHLEDPCTGGVLYDGFKLGIVDSTGLGADANETFLSRCEKFVI